MPIIQTVLGNITPERLGRTLTHEHLTLDLSGFLQPAPDIFKPFLAQSISLETLGVVRQYPYSSLENLSLNDQAAQTAVRKDLVLYKQFGGSSIVENSCHGLKRNWEFLVDASKSTGVHVVASTGHYVHAAQDMLHRELSVEEMTELYTKEVLTGVEVAAVGAVKCGFIGEVASAYPMHEFEKRAIRAAAAAQQVLGCAVSFHSDRKAEAAFEIMRLYLEAGGRADKCAMSHMEITLMRSEQVLEFAKFGCYLQYDQFGRECSYFQFNKDLDFPSDAERNRTVLMLLEEGLIDRVLLSQDIHTKHQLTSYGGHGFHHIYANVLPRLLHKGVSVEQVAQLTVNNPANWLQMSV